ncbi:MAG: hypothetical protein KJ893_08655 [Candidatus Omnitrophica bacterium]|nr:hypothetical protein [Candidatus Omnitrophota bacterium]MBU4478643.1 hypothetical protein [Candidatus Omnitrophota bacterium]
MENLKRLQSLALKLIMFLVWFDIMCFALILAGNIFKWSFLNDSVGSAFFAAFGLSLGALAALAILHITLTLNIISTSISAVAGKSTGTDEAVLEKGRQRFKRLMVVSVVGILFAVGYQGLVERNASQYKVEKIGKQLGDVAQSALAMRLADLIERDEKVNELYFARDEILLSLEGQRSVTLLIPRAGQQETLFYQVTPWDYNSKDETNISKSLRNLFVSQTNERKKFKQLVKEYEPFVVVGRNSIRAFYPVMKNNGLKLILLLDTSRSVSSEYLMSRSRGRKL